ncbi:MAG: SDR family oxidoreductase [Anaerolineaceae bacterium]|nr:SDR family oxidoreductase [Anaerolineaceae bacterium]
MDLEISGQTAILMSSTKGLGFGCAAALVAEGVNVVINGRDANRGKEAVMKLGEQAVFVQADISKPAERERLYKEAITHFGPISILVTNADGPPSGTFMETGESDWQSAFELVMLSALDMAQRCLPDMIEQGYGRIVNISSTSAKETTPGPLLANAIKPGLLGAFGTLAREVAATGVTVNSILPGPFDTERIRQYALTSSRAEGLTSEEALKIYAENKPMKRVGTINEIGALCAFLCSHQASYITGQSIVIDGGQVSSLL